MRVSSIVVAFLGVLAVASTAAAADPELGKKVYEKKCVSCHGADGKGNAKMEQMLKIKIPTLAGAAAKPDSELLKFVAEGKKPMPSFQKSLSKDELEAVVRYTKDLAAGKAAGGK